MRTSHLFRPFLIVAASGTALLARAVSIEVMSEGRYFGDYNTYYSTQTATSQTGGYGPLTNLLFDTINFQTRTGKAHYSGTGGTLNLDLSFTTMGTYFYVQAFGGTWTVASATGSYAEATGTGTFGADFYLGHAGIYDNIADGGMRGNLEIAPVPEPASLCALGLGAVATLRRRKRA